MNVIKKFLKNKVIKNIIITFFIIEGCVLLISIPKIFSGILIKTLAWISGENTTVEQNDLKGEIYQDGRKTITSFGNKRFTILKSVRFDDNDNIQKDERWFLFDQKDNKTIDSDIEGYDRHHPYVYTKGEKGYTKLNYETSEINQSQNITVFSEEGQKIFKNIKPHSITQTDSQN